jgi:hypothetical protein
MMFVRWMKNLWSLQVHKSQQEFLIFHLLLNVKAHKADHVLAAAIVAVAAAADIAVAIAVAVVN